VNLNLSIRVLSILLAYILKISFEPFTLILKSIQHFPENTEKNLVKEIGVGNIHIKDYRGLSTLMYLIGEYRLFTLTDI